jgi:hypothetical protein
MTPEDMTTTELQRLGQRLVRVFVDVMAGRLEPDALPLWLPRDLQLTPAPDLAAEERVRIGPVSVVRGDHDRVHIAAPVRRPDGTTSHLVGCQLATENGRVMIASLGYSSPTPHDLAAADQQIFNPAPPKHLRDTLGHVPADPMARMQWATAAAIITDYREAWNVADPDSALGPVPADPEQRTERDRAVQAIRELLPSLTKDAADRDEPAHDRPGFELGL